MTRIASFFGRGSPRPGGRRPRRSDLIGNGLAFVVGVPFPVVLTTVPGQTPSQVLAEYRSRDRVEKIFDSFKNENGERRPHTSVDSSAEGRIMLAFLALVLRAELENRTRSAGLLHNMTTAEALAGLRRIKAVRTRSRKRILLEVPKRQRNLLAALGVPLPE